MGITRKHEQTEVEKYTTSQTKKNSKALQLESIGEFFIWHLLIFIFTN